VIDSGKNVLLVTASLCY